MKKILSFFLLIVMGVLIAMCVSMCASGGTSSSSNIEEPFLDIEQEIVNICCRYSGCSSIGGLRIGTQNISRIDGGYEVSAKGTYYPIDEYGDYEDKMMFDISFTARWNGKSSYYSIWLNSRTFKRSD